jgi:hypothetical protein
MRTGAYGMGHTFEDALVVAWANWRWAEGGNVPARVQVETPEGVDPAQYLERARVAPLVIDVIKGNDVDADEDAKAPYEGYIEDIGCSMESMRRAIDKGRLASARNELMQVVQCLADLDATLAAAEAKEVTETCQKTA